MYQSACFPSFAIFNFFVTSTISKLGKDTIKNENYSPISSQERKCKNPNKKIANYML